MKQWTSDQLDHKRLKFSFPQNLSCGPESRIHKYLSRFSSAACEGENDFLRAPNLAKRDTRKHYRLRHRCEAREKGLCVVFASGNDEKILINSRTHTHKFRRKKFVCVSTCMRRERAIGATGKRRAKAEHFFVRAGDAIELCDKYACVYYKQRQQLRLQRGARVFVIYPHT